MQPAQLVTLASMLGVAVTAPHGALVKLLTLSGSPLTDVLTTNATPMAADLATLLRRRSKLNELAQAQRRAKVIFPCFAGFVIIEAASASLEDHFQLVALAMVVFVRNHVREPEYASVTAPEFKAA